MKGKALKKILAASLVLTLMSGAVPMTPFAQSFGVITANAKDDYELPFIPAHAGFYVTNNTDFVTVTWNGEEVTSSTQQLNDRYSVIMSADKPFTWTVGNSTNTAAQNSSGKYVVNLRATSDVTINPYYASVAHDTGYARESNIYLKPENFAEGEYFYYDKSIPTGTLRASKSENTVSFSTVLDTPVAMYDELGNQITLTQNGSVYSFEPVESETYYLIRTHIAGTEGNWDGNETGFIPVSPLPTPVVKHDNGSGIEEDVELTRANFDESGSMFMTDKSFADGEIINLQADPSTLQGLLMVKPGTSVSVYRAIYGNSIQLTKLENSDSTSDNYTFPIMEVESYYIVKDYQKDICRCDMTFYDADNNELDLDALSYTGESLVPASVKIVDRGYELVEGVDYEIVYDGEWIQPSDDDEEIYPIVSVSGLGDYAGTGTEFHGYINIESFSVTLPENMEIVNGVTLTDGMAYYGTEINFRVNDGYTASNVSDGTNALTPDENGIYTVVVKGDLTVSADIEEIPLENNSTVSAEEIVFGDSITVTADAEGGAGGFTYAVYFKKDYSSDWTVKQDFDENTEVTIKPAKATAYSVLVIAKDSRGKTSEKTFNIDVRGKLTNTSSLEKDEIYFGNDIVVNASAKGGMGDRTFAVYYKKTASDKWITAQNFSDNTSVSITPAAATTYNVVVKVKDSRGVVSRKAFTVTVNGMENTSTVTVDTGSDSDRINNIKVSCSTKGSIGDVQYAVYYKKTASDNWMIAQRFSDNTELTITPAVPTDYDVMIRARDIRGVVSKKIITVNTSKKQETSTIVIED